MLPPQPIINIRPEYSRELVKKRQKKEMSLKNLIYLCQMSMAYAEVKCRLQSGGLESRCFSQMFRPEAAARCLKLRQKSDTDTRYQVQMPKAGKGGQVLSPAVEARDKTLRPPRGPQATRGQT